MVQKFDFWMEAAAENRRIHLYLPDEYYNSGEQYAVVYMFDGHNLFYDGDATFGKCLGLRDFYDHYWKRIIVVGIECAADDWKRVCEYCPYDLESRIYGHIPGRGYQTYEWIVSSLKPYIDSHYRTYPFREGTAIAGYSMGGMMALYGVAHFNHIFSKAAVISPAIAPAMDAFRHEFNTGVLNLDTRIFLSWGSEEARENPGLEDRIREVEWLAQQKGAKTYLFRNEGGHHNEASWQYEVPTWNWFLWE